jgi:thiamine kinase-like enzyme
MLNIRRPAHSGLLIDQIEWEKPSQDEIKILQGYLSLKTIKSLRKKVDTKPKKLIGYYKSTDKESLFIKILPEDNFLFQINAEKISSWLDSSGLDVNCLKDGYPKKIIENNLWIFAYDYIDYYLSNGSIDRLFTIGNVMGHMHKLFQKYPDKKNVYDKGMEKNQILFEQLNNIKLGKVDLSFPQQAIELIKETSNSDYHLLNLGAQMIHGDMNYGNVLFNKLNDQPIIIDFEDAASAWISPLYDLAFVIQRFVLLSDVKDRYKLAAAFIKGYKLQNNLYSINKLDALFIITKMISIRSLLVLSTLPQREQKLYFDEIDKFIYLYKHTKENHSLISDIDALIKKR